MSEKTTFNARLPSELLERVRNAIWHGGNRITITRIIEDALSSWVEAEENAHNRGKPFPRRTGDIPYSKRR